MRPTIGFISAALVVLTLAACGEDAERLSRDDYVAQADTICKAGSTRVDELTEELGEKFEAGETPSDDEIRDVLGKVFDDFEQQFDELRDLTGPEELEADVEEAVDDAGSIVDELRDQLEDDPQAVIAAEDPFTDISKRLSDLGLSECGE